ncbi:hypothetical protein AAG570_012738 [Ranatra chinensis]|uniref:Uncharacterized protein n=1 Tax=Ranatra chinensis TaxID=642074 RepID=A0ABD0Z2Z5_9HEMI
MSANTKLLKGGKRQKESEMCEKLRLVDSELVSFYQYCQQMGFTPSEMEVICSPLFDVMQKNNLKRIFKVIISLLVLCATIYAATQVGSIAIHASAFGRIAMIKILPLWDWRHLFYETCLIGNPFYGEYTLTEDDCVSCESLESIDIANKVSYDFLLDNYLNRDAPIIITDAMDNWPAMNSDDFLFNNISQIYLQDEKLIDTVPCVLSTNLRTGTSDLLTFLKRIHNPAIDKWFVHWQNCDIHAVKALRKFYQRPYFLSNSVSPAHFNWVLMASDYSTNNYKTVELDSGLIMLAQLRGMTAFRLTPHKPCNESCPQLTGNLQHGEMLVFTNYLWAFEYYPGQKMDNIAVLTETVWDESTL